MTQDLIGYAKLAQNALRAVVKDALKMSLNGLPGGHHFYISFKTQYKGVQLAKYLVDKYPDEITIVIQLQYEDLEVNDDNFGVTLHFGGVPQRIIVPFNAITRFYDPHVSFALPFDVYEDLEEPEEVEEIEDISEQSPQVVSLDAFRRKK